MRKKLFLLMLTMMFLFISSVAVFADEVATNSTTQVSGAETTSSTIISPQYLFTTVIDRVERMVKVWKLSGERDELSSVPYYKELRFNNNYMLDTIDSYSPFLAEDTPFYRIEVWYDVYRYVTW